MVLIILDLNWLRTNELSRVVQVTATNGSKPAQLKVDKRQLQVLPL